jgi:hypothetical protein
MDHQEMKRPDLSAFALAVLFVLLIVSQFGGVWWQLPAAGILIGGGAWATWRVGRWAWWKHGPRVSVDYTR